MHTDDHVPKWLVVQTNLPDKDILHSGNTGFSLSQLYPNLKLRRVCVWNVWDEVIRVLVYNNSTLVSGVAKSVDLTWTASVGHCSTLYRRKEASWRLYASCDQSWPPLCSVEASSASLAPLAKDTRPL